MRSIADLLPVELRGFYSSDPAIRAAAEGTERYPWADKVEGEVVGEVKFITIRDNLLVTPELFRKIPGACGRLSCEFRGEQA